MADAKLTPSQLAAVTHRDGPLMILAGPGSGKTRVVTRRIAWLVENGVSDREILAITFTNKAAREMGERIEQVLPESRVWVSTFHSFCARLLRQHAGAVGLGRNFTIYDTTDQSALLKRVLSDVDVDSVHFPPSRVLARISDAKNDLLDAETFAEKHTEQIGDQFQSVVAKAWPQYQRAMLDANALDFDDLLNKVVQLLRENEELREELDTRFRYVLVDEYQDTNNAQYEIVRGLSLTEPNLCVTGDPDQSIYGWRGARIANILRFEQDYPEAKVVRLEENFRSTTQILAVADQLIQHNTKRKAKRLLAATGDAGPIPELITFPNERQEATGIASRIRDMVAAGDRRYDDFAVFYRVNSLSRPLETAFSRERIPYQIAGSVAFFERKEIKDVLAYLKLVHNPRDEVAFRRIINTPTRGIGAKSVKALVEFAVDSGCDLFSAAQRATSIAGLSRRAIKSINDFVGLIEYLSEVQHGSLEQLVATVLEMTGYTGGWESSESEQDHQRLANVRELVTAATQYDESHPDGNLEDFLETTSLVGDTDRLAEDCGKVTLMSLHAAKGLEFPVVFVVAVEQNLIPHERALRGDDARKAAAELEEERRLLFVGITRARKELSLSRARQRMTHGKTLYTIPSDFLQEVTLHEAVTYEAEDSQEIPERSGTIAEPNLSLADLRDRISTGASLETPGGAEIPVGFAVGMHVRHPRYGRGRVVKVSGFSKHRTLTVHFDLDDREETFVAGKSPIQPVELM